jgi:cellulose synthase/poly-beta-1,6-N-acetylglucosamine synthase-like glycosyltransferase
MVAIIGRGTPSFVPRSQTPRESADGVIHRSADYNPRPTTLVRPVLEQTLLLTAGSRATISKPAVRRKKLALLLPGHNEELIVAHTIASAIKAGMSKKDIYVVDDGSEDHTRREALRMLPRHNVLSVPKGGKAMAVLTGIKHFDIENRYSWVHVADADSVFGADYFRLYKRKLDAK